MDQLIKYLRSLAGYLFGVWVKFLRKQIELFSFTDQKVNPLHDLNKMPQILAHALK